MVRSIIGKHPQYYEAILQLRDISQEVVDYVETEFMRAKIPLTKALEVKNGIDFYVADSQFTRSLGKRLQEKFGGELLITASLYGVKKDREVYRVTVMFRVAPFRKGDKVQYRGEEYIVKMMGKKMVLQDKTGSKIELKYKEMGSVRRV